VETATESKLVTDGGGRLPELGLEDFLLSLSVMCDSLRPHGLQNPMNRGDWWATVQGLMTVTVIHGRITNTHYLPPNQSSCLHFSATITWLKY